MRYWPALVISLSFVLVGCGKVSVQPFSVKREIRVAAAANLKFAFDEIIAQFAAHNPEIDVAVTYGSSGNFFAQLTNRAPFDVFLSADVDYPRKLIDNGMAAKDSEFIYAIGRLVVWVPNSSKLDIEKHGIEVLDDPSVRKIAVANPQHTPYGRAAVAAMKKLGVYERVHARLVFGDNLDQAAHFVHSGAADVGITGLSLAVAPALKDKGRYWVIPTDSYPRLEQAGVILPWAQDNEAAERLRAFLLRAPGREVLQRYGYDLPELAQG